MELNEINKDQVKEEKEKAISRTLSKKYSLQLENKKSKSTFETNQDSFGISTNNDQANQVE